jgi:hypothetical protein
MPAKTLLRNMNIPCCMIYFFKKKICNINILNKLKWLIYKIHNLKYEMKLKLCVYLMLIFFKIFNSTYNSQFILLNIYIKFIIYN